MIIIQPGSNVHMCDTEMGTNPHPNHTNGKWGYFTRKENSGDIADTKNIY